MEKNVCSKTLKNWKSKNKKIADRKIVLLLIFSFLSITFTLTAQDVAIVGWDATGSATNADEVTFVLLRDFAAGEVIHITEDE